MAKREQKTNAMRILSTMGIPYQNQEYDCKLFTDGIDVAAHLGLPEEQVFKTLVTVGSDKQHYVFVIPVNKELDLKKCALAAGVKSVQMLPMKELFPLTGYVRGGCTAIGMKKKFATCIDESALKLDRIYVSGGRIGSQICLSPLDFCKAADAAPAELT